MLGARKPWRLRVGIDEHVDRLIPCAAEDVSLAGIGFRGRSTP